MQRADMFFAYSLPLLYGAPLLDTGQVLAAAVWGSDFTVPGSVG